MEKHDNLVETEHTMREGPSTDLGDPLASPNQQANHPEAGPAAPTALSTLLPERGVSAKDTWQKRFGSQWPNE
jgi:hypothetical protein